MKMKIGKKDGFTIVELLIVIAIIAVLSVGVIYFLNPSQLASQGRDSNRISDLTSLNQNVALYHETAPAGNLGSSSVVYISVPDPFATSTAGDQCQGLGLATSSYTYHCAASSTYRNVNGTGWLPINFSATTGVTLGTLPVDPVNTTSTGEYYKYTANGSQYEFVATPESSKTYANNQSSSYTQGNNLALLTTTGGQNIWITDYGNNNVQEYSADGTRLLQFGTQGSGNGQFNVPVGIAIDASGNIWVADQGNARVEKFSSTGTYLSQFGTQGSGNGQFSHPYAYGGIEGIAIDASGNLWITDEGNYRVEEFSSTGTYLSQFGTQGSGNGQFQLPEDLAIDASGNIWVQDRGDSRVQEFSSTGTYLSQFSTAYPNGAVPTGLSILSTGNFVMAQAYIGVIQEFSSTGTYLSEFGSYGTGNGQFRNPAFSAADTSGNIWVADLANNRVQEFSSTGTYLSQFPTGVGDATTSSPWGIAIH
jgi:prepilin-type N-terminal cleavage/methylation domain-containing protein